MDEWLESHILGTIYGNCIGDAVGLLTEFMNKAEAKSRYKHALQGDGGLEYELKVHDMHRQRWEVGDWTDDSDQMILIIDSILEKKGDVDAINYAEKLKNWVHYGYRELGDHGGLGIGATTYRVINHMLFLSDPIEAARDVWERSGCFLAPNGAVMRTSVLGVYQFRDLDAVRENTLRICKVTHADPRCQASCVAVTFAIACMLQKDERFYDKGKLDVKQLRDFAFEEGRKQLAGFENEKIYVQQLHDHMYATKLKDLKLDEPEKIGYTYKTLGAGFWALMQDDFRKALTDIAMEAGDADTNGAVAGALLGCKLGHNALPYNWLYKLLHKDWLDQRIRKFLNLAMPDLELTILPSAQHDEHLEAHMLGTLYGHCMGDAIGLLTEFMSKKIAQENYSHFINEQEELELLYNHKVKDNHRNAWIMGDWTDDTDQMILILDSILECGGEVNPRNFGMRLKQWARGGFPELGDKCGCGLGATTQYVLKHELFDKEPYKAAEAIWNATEKHAAPNGAVMRTSILGVYMYQNTFRVKRNTLRICSVTHADPRCQASCIAVTCAISFMLHRTPRHYRDGQYDLDAIIEDSFREGSSIFGKDHASYRKEFQRHMYAKKLSDLKLDEPNAIGYTFKCVGAGFWALRQTDFRKAITELIMEGGDADTNAAVAGALLGCKLGYLTLAEQAREWLFSLPHKDWFDARIYKFLRFAFPDMKLEILNEPKERVQKQHDIDNNAAPASPTNTTPGQGQAIEREAEAGSGGAAQTFDEDVKPPQQSTHAPAMTQQSQEQVLGASSGANSTQAEVQASNIEQI